MGLLELLGWGRQKKASEIETPTEDLTGGPANAVHERDKLTKKSVETFDALQRRLELLEDHSIFDSDESGEVPDDSERNGAGSESEAVEV